MTGAPGGGAADGGNGVFGVLRDRDFARMITAQGLSNTGDWLLLVAAPYYVLRLTGSTLATGLSLAAETVPALLIGPVAGVLADRWDRRRTMITTDLLRALAVSAMLLVHRADQIGILYAALVAEAAFGQFFTPARQAILPAITGRGDRLTEANSLSALVDGTVRLLAGPAGGALYGLAGFRPVVAVDVASYLVSAALVTTVRHRTGPAARGPAGAGVLRRFAAELREGAGHARRTPGVPPLLAAAGIFFIGNAVLTAVLVPYTGQVLHASAGMLGWLFSTLGAGYVVGGPIARRLTARTDARTAVAGGMGGLALVFAAAFGIHDAAWDLALFALIGTPAVCFLVTAGTYLARHTPDRLMGRVTSLYTVVQAAAGFVGVVGGSLLAARAGITTTAWLASAAAAAGALTALRIPRGAGGPGERAGRTVAAGPEGAGTRALPGNSGHEIS